MTQQEIEALIKKQMDFEFRESIRCEEASVQYAEVDGHTSHFYYDMATMFTHCWSVLRKLLKEIKK